MLRVLTTSLFFTITIALLGQTRQVQTYSVADGLAQSQVYTVWNGVHGYVWAGTQGGGLSRFDGLKFKTFSTADGLPGNYINDLWQDSKENIWIGTEQGLACYDGQVFKTYFEGEKIIAIDGKDTELWVLTEKSLFYNTNNTDWKELKFPKSYMRVYDLVVEKNRLLIGTDRGAWQWKNNRWTQLELKDEKSLQIWAFYQYRNAQTWGLSPSGKLFSIGKDTLREQPIPNCIPTVFYISPDGDTWLGTQKKGLFVLYKGASEWKQILKKDGLGSNFIKSITADHWGNIWVGNSGGGLSCLRHAPFRSFDQQRGLPGKEVYALLQDDSLGLLMSLNGKGIFRQGQQGPGIYNNDEAIRSLTIKSLALDKNKHLWIGTHGQGLKVETDSSWLDVNSCGMHIQDLLANEEGQFWVATAYEGLSLLGMREDSNGVNFVCQTFGERDGLPVGRIESLAYNNNGQLLITYRDQGVACWLPGKLFWHVNRRNGLPVASVRAIRQDSTGYYWLATPNGLIRLGWQNDKVQIKLFTTQDGLESANLYSLVLDREQHLWVGSERGVDGIELNAARLPRQITFYGQEEGFTGIENCSDAAVLDQEGNLWFGTMSGLMMKANAPYEWKQIAPPKLMMGDVRIFYESIRHQDHQQVLAPWGDIQEALVLNNNQNHLGFHLTGLDLAHPNDIRYQWKLEGWDEQWSPPQEQQDITYANLPPGHYRFLAKAIGEGARKSENLALNIQIIPAFWQTKWFQTLSIAASILFLLLFIWFWIKRWQRKQKQVEERLRLDHKLLELEQKALQLQMNPHFLANALQGIQYELGQGDHDKASRYLRKFGEFMRTTLYHSRSNKITLSDEIEGLKHYLDIEKFRLGDRFTYHFDLPDALEVDLISIPPMLLQPFLENAIHHAMPSKKGNGKLDIIIREKGLKHLLVTIRDNGAGLGKSKKRKSNHRSTALKVIQERLELLGETFDNKAFSINEIITDDKIKGVEVVIVLPVL